jgi:hypothetical protein
MKRLILVFILTFFCKVSFTQTLPDYSAIKLEVKEDYNSTANDAALQAANYILSTPIDNNNIDRIKSIDYVSKWSQGTPDYHFTLGDKIMQEFYLENDDLLDVYMAAMVKYVLENKEDSKEQKRIKLNSAKLIIAYSKVSKNNVKFDKELENLIEADNKGELVEYLKL